ncbi:MAG: hypothetical protein F6K58_22510 [Symploca sp. SIO2E9]|nr:hypothetical protein [Symploca sp. SIO2E9]
MSRRLELSEKQLKFAKAIAQGYPVRTAASIAECSEATGWRWKRSEVVKYQIELLKDESTQERVSTAVEALKEAGESYEGESAQRVLNKFHREDSPQVISTLSKQIEAAIPVALSTILDIAADGKHDRDRFVASKFLFELAGYSDRVVSLMEKREGKREGKRRGLSTETVNEIYSKVLGVNVDEEETPYDENSDQ